MRANRAGLWLGCLILAMLVLSFAFAPRKAARVLKANAPRSGGGIVLIDGVAKIDVNSADAQLLSALPGVGEVLARRIVASREQYGKFENAEALLRVDGIGKGKLNAMRERVFA